MIANKGKKKATIAMTDEEADFAAIVYVLDRFPRVRRVIELLMSPRTMSNRAEFQNIVGRYRWSIVADLGGEIVYTPAPDSKDYEEAATVLNLLKLDPKRMRRCTNPLCADLFYAGMRNDQEFCKGKNCRQRFYQRDPVRYAKRKAHMRFLYSVEVARQLEERKALLPKAKKR